MIMVSCPECGEGIAPDAPLGVCPRCLLNPALARTAMLESLSDQPAGSAGSGDLGELFPHLEILECLGQGGMGVVHKARQVKLDRMVALKVIRRELANEAAFAERFTREARAMARLNHPNIVMIHDFGAAGGVYYLVMELVEGGDLRRILRRGPLGVEAALLTALQVCDALDDAHRQGVIHRDIKPENVLLDRRGQVKLADFGLAKLLEPPSGAASLTASRHVLGTPQYMAPEQLEGTGPVDHRADIYSVAVLLYEMLTGKTPFGRYDLPSELLYTDEALDDILGRALSRDPAKRHATISELRIQLAEFAQENYELSTVTSSLTQWNQSAQSTNAPAAADDSGGEWWLWLIVLLPVWYWFVLPPIIRTLNENLDRGWPRLLGYAGAIVFATALVAAASLWRRFLRRGHNREASAITVENGASVGAKPRLPGASAIADGSSGFSE